ncbi:MAG: ATP-binding protein [Armatimonadetes bacterium]|nr:ATP-binding protein [Armatimonadota bacterium]
METEDVGLVLGSLDATPLEFWIGVQEGAQVQLDDLVVVAARAVDGQEVHFYGMVDLVRKKYEGTQFDSDAFRAAAGHLPVEVSYAAHVQVTRIDPEIFIPPHPGDRARVVRGEDFQKALSFDTMEHRLPIGLTRGGESVFANLEFLDGTRGAHCSISGISGVATKTSYASFLLYSLFNSGALGTRAINAKALIFNVKGEDLLWLDKPNARLNAENRALYERLGLEARPFDHVGLYAPPTRSAVVPMPDVGSRQDDIRPYVWTMREFARGQLLRFVFTDADDARQQFSFVVTRVERALERAAQEGDKTDPAIVLDGDRVGTFFELLDKFEDGWLESVAPGMASGTLDAFRRRVNAAAQHMGHLVRDVDMGRYDIRWMDHRVTVVDIHKLHATAQMFVVGVLLKRLLSQKEDQASADPLVFVMLDELNKYAPREGWSPIREVLLDIAERGRSLGVSLFGAQQTASEVARRVVANAAIKIVGRLDAAEAERGEYGFLSKIARLRATLLQPGSMLVAQPEIPVPILLRFPFPSWATRASEAALPENIDDLLEGMKL